MPVWIFKKPEKGLRVFVDNRTLNALTIKNRNNSSLICKTFARFFSAKIYLKSDIIPSFNEIYIREKDKKKRGFHIKYGLYESILMPLRLWNASRTFQSYIKETFREFLEDFGRAYFHDILIYIQSISLYRKYVQEILSKLCTARLFLHLCQYDFDVYKNKYFEIVLETTGLRIDCRKVDTIETREYFVM